MGLTAVSKINVFLNDNNFLNTPFDYFSYFLLVDVTQGLTSLQISYLP